ncbi:MAG: hypothetical protein WEB03_10480 [Nitriliruptor sp.]|uniref:hypothetical protein n=1 Tax=Nitriliruptor sp. TaxID=2448056 RepID=UPI0034A0260F
MLDVLADPFSVRELSHDGSVTKYLILGDDRSGRAFEVVALTPCDDVLLVIHAMDLRDKYREEYERGRGDEPTT